MNFLFEIFFFGIMAVAGVAWIYWMLTDDRKIEGEEEEEITEKIEM
jgi:hypothetical protein